jgi:hypothetical protein
MGAEPSEAADQELLLADCHLLCQLPSPSDHLPTIIDWIGSTTGCCLGATTLWINRQPVQSF